MNQPEQSKEDSRLDEEAAEWLYEREEGFEPGRAKAFSEWCERDPRHAQAVARVERMAVLLEGMPAMRAPLAARLATRPACEPAAAPGSASVLRFPRRMWVAGLAAAVVIGAFAWWRASPGPSTALHYTTNTDAPRSLVLPDGSVMDLNTGSDVSVRLTPGTRQITLSKGEAHFQVAHDATRPFVVIVGDLSIQAVGTAFDVRLAAGEVDVFVVEGTVALARRQPVVAPAAVAAQPLLHAGERAQVSRADPSSTPKIEKVDAPSIRAILTWENPLTSFTDVPLRDVVTRFNRRNATQLVLEDPALGARKIGGIIALDQVDAFVGLLALEGDVVAEQRATGEIALRRAH